VEMATSFMEFLRDRRRGAKLRPSKPPVSKAAPASARSAESE
jgi:hypothetical protein